MIAMSRGQVSSPSAPALFFVSQNVGQAVPASALAYRILDIHTPELEANPVQLFPGSGWQPVDLVNDLIPLDAMNPTAGFYVARYTVPSDPTFPVGKYAIEWQYTLTNPQSETYTVFNSENPPSGVARKNFEVIGAAQIPQAPTLYSFLADARAVAACGSNVSDIQLRTLINRASRMIDRYTGRTFGTQYQTIRAGGLSARGLLLGPPIVSISSVGIDTEPTQRGDLVVELDLLRVFNRHLAQGLTDPDDREDPKIEFVHSDDLYGIRFIPFRGISLRSLAMPIGVQNIHIRGFFGYTDPDGSPWGDVPELIQHACRLIVRREAAALGSDAREDAQWRWRLINQKTRDNQLQMAPPREFNGAFGDPEIDSILASYVRPPRIGSA